MLVLARIGLPPSSGLPVLAAGSVKALLDPAAARRSESPGRLPPSIRVALRQLAGA
jgi:hypothetical protein